MTIPTSSFGLLYGRYFDALSWISELGIVIRPNRTSHYERVLRHWKEHYKNASNEDARNAFPDFVSSLFEIRDFVSVYDAFKDVPQDQLSGIVEKLRKGVNGPINAVEETPRSTAARNALFEALVAARSHRPQVGVSALLDAKSDTGLRMGNRKAWVECKRITSFSKIESNIRKATKQLEGILGRQIGAGHRGIVAIDISKLFNRGDQIYVQKDDAHLEASVNQIMDGFIESYSHVWQRIYERKNKKIIGTMIRCAFMATSEARRLLVYSENWAMNPRLSANKSDLEFQRQIVYNLNREMQRRKVLEQNEAGV